MPGAAIHGAETNDVCDELQRIISYAQKTE